MKPPHTKRRIIGLVVVVGIAVALTASDTLHEMVRMILDRAAAVIAGHPLLGKVLFVALSTLSAMLAFVSSAVVVPVAVFTWGRTTTLVLLWGSWLLGGIFAYLLGRTLGRRVLSWFVAGDRIDYYASRISAGADFVTILLFQLALPSEVPGYVLGAARYRFLRYVAALAIAELPFAVGAVYLGEGFIRRDYRLLIGFGIAGVAFSAIAFYRLHRRLADGPARSVRT
ncbi:MAG TPA: VTT domain-containing protein [Thermoanaerobaculia bacterium]|nr:VTT domain-containing protein [Thermoanaerobaculia bacterium]